jgi:AcrR family transcriptional regulator
MALPAKQPSRDKILDHAEALFARRGFAGIGLAEVAEAVGLGKSSLFHHFHSKAQLYAAVIARILARIESVLMRSLAAGGTATERMERWIDVLTETLGAHPTYARLLLRSLFEDDELGGDIPEELEANEVLRRIVSAGGLLLKQGMESGEFRSANVAHTLQSLIGAIVFHFASGEFGDEMLGRSLFTAAEVRRRKAEVKALVLRGLAASPQSSQESRLRRIR